MTKPLFVLSFLFSIFGFSSDSQYFGSPTGTLTIVFTGLESDEGTVKVAVANSEKNYKDHQNPFIGLTIPISNKKSIAVIDELPFGEYAVKAFHDEDGNDMLNTNFLGIPTEDYGFSNDARGMFGPPSWSDAKFLLNSEQLTITVTIK
jgi:uncharacterized protein (DUF2141 family)